MSQRRGQSQWCPVAASPTVVQLVMSPIFSCPRRHEPGGMEAVQSVPGAESSSNRLLVSPRVVLVHGDVASFDIVAVLS
jgi:hypothetical protein